jgi:hypothetical protein
MGDEWFFLEKKQICGRSSTAHLQAYCFKEIQAGQGSLHWRRLNLSPDIS